MSQENFKGQGGHRQVGSGGGGGGPPAGGGGGPKKTLKAPKGG